MAKKRQQVEDLREAQPLQPQAQAVNSYVRPGMVDIASPSRSNALMGLAEALEKTSPQIKQVTDELKAKEIQEAIQQGMLDADRSENREAFNKAIMAGEILPGQSPWYTIGAITTKARNDAKLYVAGLRDAHDAAYVAAKNEGKEFNFERFISDYRSSFIEKHGAQGPYWSREFYKHNGAIEAKMAENNGYMVVEDRHEEMEKQTADSVLNTIEGALLDPDAQDADIPAIIANLKALEDQQAEFGMPRKDFNKQVLRVAAWLYQETGDEDVRDILNAFPTGPGGSLGNTAEAKAIMNEGQKSYFRTNQAKESWANQKEDREKKERSTANASKLQEAIDNGVDIMGTDEYKALLTDDPNWAAAMKERQRQVREHRANPPEDSSEVMLLRRDIQAGRKTLRDLDQYAALGKLKDSTYKELNTLAQDREMATPAFSNPTAKHIWSQLNAAIENKTTTMVAMMGDNPLMKEFEGELNQILSNGHSEFSGFLVETYTAPDGPTLFGNANALRKALDNETSVILERVDAAIEGIKQKSGYYSKADVAEKQEQFETLLSGLLADKLKDENREERGKAFVRYIQHLKAFERAVSARTIKAENREKFEAELERIQLEMIRNIGAEEGLDTSNLNTPEGTTEKAAPLPKDTTAAEPVTKPEVPAADLPAAAKRGDPEFVGPPSTPARAATTNPRIMVTDDITKEFGDVLKEARALWSNRKLDEHLGTPMDGVGDLTTESWEAFYGKIKERVEKAEYDLDMAKGAAFAAVAGGRGKYHEDRIGRTVYVAQQALTAQKKALEVVEKFRADIYDKEAYKVSVPTTKLTEDGYAPYLKSPEELLTDTDIAEFDWTQEAIVPNDGWMRALLAEDKKQGGVAGPLYDIMVKLSVIKDGQTERARNLAISRFIDTQMALLGFSEKNDEFTLNNTTEQED